MDIPGPRQRHVSVGNLNLDVTMILPRLPGPEETVFAERYWVGPGGSATNYAMAVAKLGHEAMLIAVTGPTALRLGLLDYLNRSGVDTSHVRVVDDMDTGVVSVLSVPSTSTRSMASARGANTLLSPSDVPEGVGEHIHFSSVNPSIILDSPSYPSSSYDPGGEAFRRPREVLEASTRIDYLLVNSRELEALTGGASPSHAYRLLEGRLKAVIVKKGVKGAYAVTDSIAVEGSPPPTRDVVDVAGAGDAFNAAFITWMLAGRGLEEALRAGIAAGAAKVSLLGSSNMPGLDKVLGLMRIVPEARRLLL